MRISSKSVLITLFILANPVAASSTNMQEGNWEIITSINIQGVSFSMPPIKMTHCYTKKEIEENKNPAAVDTNSNNGCEFKDLKSTGKTSSWKMLCKDGSKGNGLATYEGNSFTTTMNMSDKNGGASTTVIKGKRLGDCK